MLVTADPEHQLVNVLLQRLAGQWRVLFNEGADPTRQAAHTLRLIRLRGGRTLEARALPRIYPYRCTVHRQPRRPPSSHEVPTPSRHHYTAALRPPENDLSMGVTVKNSDVIVRAVRERIAQMRQKFEQRMQDLATEIVTRTKDGVDVNGQTFAEYTPAYAKYRAEHGYQTTPPNLTITGNMLNAVQAEVTESTRGLHGRIYFNSATEALKASGNQKKRPFFGLSDEQVKQLKSDLAE